MSSQCFTTQSIIFHSFSGCQHYDWTKPDSSGNPRPFTHREGSDKFNNFHLPKDWYPVSLSLISGTSHKLFTMRVVSIFTQFYFTPHDILTQTVSSGSVENVCEPDQKSSAFRKDNQVIESYTHISGSSFQCVTWTHSMYKRLSR